MTLFSVATALSHMDGWGWGMAGFGLVILLLLAVMLASIWSASRPFSSPPSMSHTMEILSERYARGEIGREEYLALKSELER